MASRRVVGRFMVSPHSLMGSEPEKGAVQRLVSIAEHVENDAQIVRALSAGLQKVGHGCHSDTRRLLLGKTEDSRGDAAESHRVEPMHGRLLQASPVRAGESLPVRLRQLSADDGADSMDDEARRQVEAGSEEGLARRESRGTVTALIHRVGTCLT